MSKALQQPGLYGFDAGKEAVAVPAHAGTAGLYAPMSAADRDHPRLRGDHLLDFGETIEEVESSPMRGDHQQDNPNGVLAVGSSPHVRGPHATPKGTPIEGGIIHACAGTTEEGSQSGARSRDHPRMCRDHSSLTVSVVMRGDHVLVLGQLGLDAGIIPAYAGTTRGRGHPTG